MDPDLYCEERKAKLAELAIEFFSSITMTTEEREKEREKEKEKKIREEHPEYCDARVKLEVWSPGK